MKIKFIVLILISVAFSVIFKSDVNAQTNSSEIISEIKKIITQENTAINEQFDYYFYEKKLFEEAYTKYGTMFLINNEDGGNESTQMIDITSAKSMNYIIPPNKDFFYIIKFQISNGPKSEVVKLSTLGNYSSRKYKDEYCMYHLADKNGNKESEINFKDDFESGIEKAYYENGIKIKEEKIANHSDAYEGNCSNGVGKIETENGTYIGEFKDDKITGLGTIYLPNEEFYFGTFNNNSQHGLNYHVYSNWEFEVSYFNYGEKSETKINAYKAIDDLDLSKRGCVSGDCENGYGVYIFSGNWDGDVYIGTWKNGYRDGIGNYYFKNGAIYNGEYKENQFSGKGTYFFENGDVFIGNRKNDLRHGKGLYIFDDLTYKKGIWFEGEFTN